MTDDPVVPVFTVPARGGFNQELAGTYHYRDVLTPLLPQVPTFGEPAKCDIVIDLVPEPDNPYDKRAVSARVDGKVIGYLPKELAADYALPVQRIVASGAVVRASASVYAYLSSRNYENEFYVRVALPEVDEFAPINTDYPATTSLLPFGRSYQVMKEEQHFDHLFDYVPKSGTGMLILTMHRLEQQLKNGNTRELVELRLDGERVGELTSATSPHYLPVVRHAEDLGRTVGIWSRIKGSGVAAELTIHGAKATEVTDEWLRTMPVVPRLVPVAHSYQVPPAFTGERRSSKRPTGQRPTSTSKAPVSKPASVSRPAVATVTVRGAQVELLGPTEGKDNPIEYRVRGKQISITDSTRKFTPKQNRTFGTVFLCIGLVVGVVLTFIPAIGFLLAIAAWIMSIYFKVHANRESLALEAQLELDGSTYDVEPGWSDDQSDHDEDLSRE